MPQKGFIGLIWSSLAVAPAVGQHEEERDRLAEERLLHHEGAREEGDQGLDVVAQRRLVGGRDGAAGQVEHRRDR